MALDWSVKNVKNAEELWEKIPGNYVPQMFDALRGEGAHRERLRSFVVATIFALGPIGFTDITDKNKKEVALRMVLWQKVNGPLLKGAKGDIAITTADIYRLVGLSTNWGNHSWTSFTKHLRRIAEVHVANDLRKMFEEEKRPS